MRKIQKETDMQKMFFLLFKYFRLCISTKPPGDELIRQISVQLGKSWFLLVSRRRKIKSPNNNTENMSEIKSSLLAFSSSSASSQERFKTTKSNKYHRWKWQSWAQAAPRHPFPGAAGLAQGSCPTHQAFFSLQKPQLSFFPLLCSPS